MLDFLRKRKRSWIIGFFIFMIVAVFIFWGVGTNLYQAKLESVAKVNGEVISQRDLELHYQRAIELYRNVFKGNLTQETIRSLNLRSAVVEELIRKRLLLQEARRLGLEVTDEELMDAIYRMAEFQVNGRFSKERYLQALRFAKLTPGQFELEQREQLTTQKLYNVIQDAVEVTEAEVLDRYRIEQERVNFYFIRLSASDFASQVQVTEEEIKDHYARNREALKEPLRVQVEYLTYPFDHFSAKVQVSEKEIDEYYESHRQASFTLPKAARVRHILLRIPSSADLKQKEAVRSKAEGVLREIRAGKNFAELAKKYSEDPSAVQGGDVGWFTQGQMLPSLDEAAFTLKKGEVSGVLETSLGYHILKVEEAREGKTKSRKEAAGDIVRAIRTERGKSEAGKAVDADREKVLSGTELSALAKERGIAHKTTPFFTHFDALPGLGRAEEFSKAAFALGLNEISPAIDGSNAYYLLKVKGRKEPSVPPLESVRSDIENRLKEVKAFELATHRANALLQQLKKEKDIKKLAKEHGLQLEETGWFIRKASEIPKVGALQNKAGGIPISLPQPIPDRIYTQNNVVYLFAFKESQGADLERFEKEKAQLQEQALGEKRQKALLKFIDSLKAKAQITLNSQYLEES